MKVWVALQVEDHACGWIWGVFTTKQLAEEWCAAEGHDSVDIEEFEIDGRVTDLANGVTLSSTPSGGDSPA